MRKRGKIALAGLGAVALIYFGNASWAWADDGRPTLLAHRGVAQQFSREGLTNRTCTAERMLPPTHGFLENTIPSMAKAFELGADMVEIDIHPTSDGEFVVFHDWTVDCRTEGKGVTRKLTLAELKRLDIGHGYTADGGKTYPFRGKFVGAMPTLLEVLDRFPTQRFLVNIKSNDRREADLLVAYLRMRGADMDRLSFVGGDRPVRRLRQIAPTVRAVSKPQMKSCGMRYLASGWTGHVPESCRNSLFFVPVDFRALAWGWPNLLAERMRRANSEVVVMGPLQRSTGTSGSTSIDDLGTLARVPVSYSGLISTDRIDIIGPAVKARK